MSCLRRHRQRRSIRPSGRCLLGLTPLGWTVEGVYAESFGGPVQCRTRWMCQLLTTNSPTPSLSVPVLTVGVEGEIERMCTLAKDLPNVSERPSGSRIFTVCNRSRFLMNGPVDVSEGLCILGPKFDLFPPTDVVLNGSWSSNTLPFCCPRQGRTELERIGRSP